MTKRRAAMMQIVAKWRVTVTAGGKVIGAFFVSDNHLSNVLALVSKMEFIEPDDAQVDGIEIERWLV